MSLIAHPEILRRRRIWEERELIEPQFGRKTIEEAERLRQQIIKEEIAKREREHQIHLSQFELERVYSTNETHTVFIFGFLLICFMLIIYPWQSPSTLWKPEFFMDGKNGTSTWSDIPKTSLKKYKTPPMPRPSPLPNPRRMDIKLFFFKQRPKTLPPPAKAMPMVLLKKDQAIGAKMEGENSNLPDLQLKPTRSTSPEAVKEHSPPTPTQTQGSQDWIFTLGSRVSKRLEKGRRKL